MDRLGKNIVFWLAILVLAALSYRYLGGREEPLTELSFSDFLDQVEAGKVVEVTLIGREIEGVSTEKDTSGKSARFRSVAPDYPELVDHLRKHRVIIYAKKPGESNYLVTILSWFPMLLLIGIWIFFMRRMQKPKE